MYHCAYLFRKIECSTAFFAVGLEILLEFAFLGVLKNTSSGLYERLRETISS